MNCPGGVLARAAGACLLALLVACGGGGRQPKTCSRDADCGAGLCVAGYCAANSAPAAVIGGAPIASLAVGDQLVLDGSGSADPDPGDSVAGYAWSISGGDCAALPAWSAQPKLDTVFACTGTYTVALVVTDSHGSQSAPATVMLTVSAAGASGGTNSSPTTEIPPPTVVASADLALDHACQAGTCTPVSETGSQILRLAASGGDALGAAVSYHWSYEPPAELAGLPPPKVEFLSGADAAEVEVRISTAGTPLSGAWRFFVTVTDVRNKRARDEVVVTVKDRPVQASAGAPLTVAHRYDKASARYVAEGVAPVRWTEPDGDPVRTTAALEGARPPSCALTTSAADAGVQFRLECASLAELAGAEMSHVLAFTGTDPAGNTATARFPLTVLDQPPALSSPQAGAPLSPPHRYDPVTQRYVSEVALDLAWSDPDGDPTTLSWSLDAPPDAGCALVPSVTGTRAVVRLECPQLSPLVGADVTRNLVLTASDGGPGTTTLSFPVRPANVAPAVSGGSIQVLDHLYDPTRQRYVAQFSAPVTASDPDGDPVTLAWADEASRPNGCTFTAERDAGGVAHVRLECADPLELTGGGVTHVAVLTATDAGGASARTAFQMAIGDRPPVLTAPATLALDHGVDVPGAAQSYRVQGAHAFQVVDPDGDPVTTDLQVEVEAGWAPHAAASTSSGGAFLLQVPIAYPGELRRADDTSPFTLVATARDPWQAAQARTAVRVKDRPPVLTTASAPASVGHRYDGAAYRTDPTFVSGIWTDPDGDPLQAAPTASGPCARLGAAASGAGYQVTLACDLPYAVEQGGTPPLATLAREHRVPYAVSDAFGQSATGEAVLTVLDRAPVPSLATGNCRPHLATCSAYQHSIDQTVTWTQQAAPSFDATPMVTDPDGDPVQVTWKATQPDPTVAFATCYPVQGIQATCASGRACAPLAMGGCSTTDQASCSAEVAGTLGIEITDGVVTLSASAAVPSCH